MIHNLLICIFTFTLFIGMYCVCHVCGYPQRLEEGVRLPGAGSCEPRDLGAGAELGSSGRTEGALAH